MLIPLFYGLGLYIPPAPPSPPGDPYDVTAGLPAEVDARVALTGWDREQAACQVLMERRTRAAARLAFDLSLAQPES